MGGLISSPEVPPPTVIQVPVPVAPPVSVTASSTPEESAEEAAASAREENLLRRNRGRFGTVQTGFSGLLGVTESGEQRKTLLGE